MHIGNVKVGSAGANAGINSAHQANKSKESPPIDASNAKIHDCINVLINYRTLLLHPDGKEPLKLGKLSDWAHIKRESCTSDGLNSPLKLLREGTEVEGKKLDDYKWLLVTKSLY